MQNKRKEFPVTWMVSLTLLTNLFIMLAANSPLYAEEIQNPAGKTLTLNGIGIWQKYRKDLVLQALYLPYPSADIPAISQPGLTKRLEMRILAKKIRPRLFRKMLLNLMLVNSSADQFSKVTPAVEAFLSVFVSPLRTGDIVTIDNLNDQLTEVRINSVLVKKIKANGLAEALLMAWTGKLPPSPGFKQAILGKGDKAQQAQLLDAYRVLEPTEGRIAETKFWVKQIDNKSAAPSMVSKAKSASSLAKVTPKRSQKATTQPKKAPLTVAKVALKKEPHQGVKNHSKHESTNPSKPEATQTTTNTEVARIKPPIDTKPSVEPPSETGPTIKPHDSTTEAGNESSTQTQVVAEAKGSDTPPLEQAQETAEDSDMPSTDDLELETTSASVTDTIALYKLRKAYEHKIVVQIRKYQKYPVKAYRNRQQGEGRIEVIVGKDGSLISTSMKESTRYRILDRAAVKAVKKAAPFPPMPEGLSENRFELFVPIAYRL